MFCKGLKHEFYRMKAWCCYVVTFKSDGFWLQSKSGPYLQRGKYDFIWEEKPTEFLLAYQGLKTKNESSRNSKFLNGSNPLTLKMIGLIAIQSRDYFPEESQKVQLCLGLGDFMCPYFWVSISGIRKDLCFLPWTCLPWLPQIELGMP